jgi:putative membrane protein
MRHERHIAKSALAGIIGGLAGVWAMNQYSAASQKVQETWKKTAHNNGQQPQQPSSEEDDATMMTADRVATLVTGRHLTKQQKKTAGPIVQYAYGAFLGGLYGGLAALSPLATTGAGTAYGSAVWLVGDEYVVPKLGLAKPASEYPVSVHANALASHLTYAVTTNLVRKAVLAIL